MINEISMDGAYQIIKWAVIGFSMLAAGSCATGCGFALGESVQLSTTGWQHEWNKARISSAANRGEGSGAPMEAITASDRRALNRRMGGE